MTDHKTLIMHQEERRITKKEWIKGILDMDTKCCVAFHDEPFPYIVPMNYGYTWDDKLTFYFHMAIEGHRVNLIRKNPKVSVNVSLFLDRHGYPMYRKEPHDYRSVTAYGTAEIITPDQEEEFLHGMTVLCAQTGRPAVKQINTEMKERLFVLKITADIVTAKAQYPIETADEVPMPENQAKE